MIRAMLIDSLHALGVTDEQIQARLTAQCAKCERPVKSTAAVVICKACQRKYWEHLEREDA